MNHFTLEIHRCGISGPKTTDNYQFVVSDTNTVTGIGNLKTMQVIFVCKLNWPFAKSHQHREQRIERQERQDCTDCINS